jgi:hypothetical protein
LCVIQDDQKTMYNDVPPLTPIKFCVKMAQVQRDEHGVFHISAGMRVCQFLLSRAASAIQGY